VATTDAADIRDMTESQVRERIGQLRQELFRLRIRSGMMQLENPQLPRQIRREIARMKTIVRERELQAERG
jgi:large subunit ribosomal protein L29